LNPTADGAIWAQGLRRATPVAKKQFTIFSIAVYAYVACVKASFDA
jgi:hypothetical protein